MTFTVWEYVGHVSKPWSAFVPSSIFQKAAGAF